MATVLLILVVVLVLAALVFGVVSLLSGSDPGLGAVEPDGRAVSLPNNRSLTETDLKTVRFDLGWRGYRMAQVDRVLRRTAYDVGYKDEMIAVLEAEVLALREGRSDDADLLRTARESAANPSATADTATTLDAPASWDGDLPAERSTTSESTTSGSADSQAATRDPAVLAEHRGRPDGGAEGAAFADRAVDKEAAVADAAVEAAANEEAANEEVADDEASDEEPADEEAARVESARREAATPGRLADRSRGNAVSAGTSSGQADRSGQAESRSPSGPARAASNGHATAGADSNVQASAGPDSNGSASAGPDSNGSANSASNRPAKASGNSPAKASGNGPAKASGNGGGQEPAEPSTDWPARA
jgi:DivIVA domain-containing protein